MRLSGINFKSEGGAVVHVVVNESGATVGWVNEIFPDVAYVKFADVAKELGRKSVRYRSVEDALAAFES